MTKKTLRCCLAVTAVLVLSLPSYGRKKKAQADTTEPAVAEEPQELTEKDKAKMEEIGQRPKVKEEIEQRWEDAKRADMEVAYAINTRATGRLATRSADEDTLDRVVKSGGLYDNPILQEYVNSLGQSLVPENSPHLYAFKLILNPVPQAESLSTGTVYISTGLVSMLDNEAQLAYVLGHEIAHVEKMHQYQQIRNSVLEEELITEKQKEANKKRMALTAVAAGVGGGIGGAIGGSAAAMQGAAVGLMGGLIASKYVVRQRLRPTEWTKVEEDEADEFGLKLALGQGFDVREAPKTYARLDTLVSKDSRVGLGFIGNKQRMQERQHRIQDLLSGAMKADLETGVKAGLKGSSADFSLLMAALKRDNGIVALDYDLFPMAKDNLEDAVSVRSNDPRAEYYLGKVTALTGRTADEKQQALSHFLKAIQYDAARGGYPEPHLQYALNLMGENNPADQAKVLDELKTYVTLYQRQNGGQVPSNMPIIYDYMLLAGESSWFVPPVANVSTNNVDAIRVVSAQPAASGPSTQPAARRQTAGSRNLP